MADEPPRFMTLDEVAVMLDRSPLTVRRMRARGDLPYLPGRPIVVERSDVVAVLDARRAKARRAIVHRLKWEELTPEEQQEKTNQWVRNMQWKAYLRSQRKRDD